MSPPPLHPADRLALELARFRLELSGWSDAQLAAHLRQAASHTLAQASATDREANAMGLVLLESSVRLAGRTPKEP